MEAEGFTEGNARSRLAQIARLMRVCRLQRQELDQKWLTLQAEAIELQDHIRLFEIDRVERPQLFGQ